jgi:hypothetical protein
MCACNDLQVNKLSAALEDLSDEAVLLRRKAGLPANKTLDTAGIKLQKDITIAQLRSVNALLERQVCMALLQTRHMAEPLLVCGMMQLFNTR